MDLFISDILCEPLSACLILKSVLKWLLMNYFFPPSFPSPPYTLPPLMFLCLFLLPSLSASLPSLLPPLLPHFPPPPPHPSSPSFLSPSLPPSLPPSLYSVFFPSFLLSLIQKSCSAGVGGNCFNWYALQGSLEPSLGILPYFENCYQPYEEIHYENLKQFHWWIFC